MLFCFQQTEPWFGVLNCYRESIHDSRANVKHAFIAIIRIRIYIPSNPPTAPPSATLYGSHSSFLRHGVLFGPQPHT